MDSAIRKSVLAIEIRRRRRVIVGYDAAVAGGLPEHRTARSRTQSRRRMLGNSQSARRRPGHYAIVWFDEISKFFRKVPKQARQPLEEKAVCAARSSGNRRFAVRFLPTAAMNSCACGHQLFGSRREFPCNTGTGRRTERGPTKSPRNLQR